MQYMYMMDEDRVTFIMYMYVTYYLTKSLIMYYMYIPLSVIPLDSVTY